MQHRPAEINMFNCPAPVSLEVEDDYQLRVGFSNGAKVDFDFKPYFAQEGFAPLKDAGLFKKANLSRWAIVWNKDIDIAIEEVYEKGALVAGD